MFLKQAGQPNTYDVFLGQGWDNWSRVRINQDGTASCIGGISLSPHFLQHAQNRVSSMFYSDLRSKRRKQDARSN